MPIANVISTVKTAAQKLGVFEFGSSNFMRIEDQFLTEQNINSLNGESSNSPQEIIIACKNKNRRVCGILNGGVKLTGEATWEELFGGGITSIGGSLIGMVNSGAQLWRGTSIQQPWMNRKFYKSTKPFSFSFQMNFISDENGGKIDVWYPTQALLSFVFPRRLKTAQAISNALDSSSVINMEQANSDGGKGLLKAGVEAIAQEYAIPGPAIGYGPDGKKNHTEQDGDYDGNGDTVTLVIGNLFAFGGVYIEKADVEYSPNMDFEGFPLWAKCNVTVTVMDVNYCDDTGEFMINRFADNQAELSSLIDSLKTAVSDVKEGVLNIVKTTKNAYS